MAKVSKGKRKSGSERHKVSPYALSSHSSKVLKDVQKKKCSKALEKKEWKDAICPVCMEYPHKAVLLLCSSYNKGCRPFMCATSNRYSNCLEQYKRAYTKVTSTQIAESCNDNIDDLGSSLGLGCHNEMTETSELLCPLCRGQVKGWTVVEPARKYLNTKRRTCVQDNCSFVGTYEELRKHVRVDHRWARPREVDPLLAEKWKKLEHDREREDVISTIRSSMPGSIVIGDYVIEMDYHGFPGNYDVDNYLGDAIFRFEPFGGGNDSLNSQPEFNVGYHSWDDEDDVEMHNDGNEAISGHVDGNYVSRFTRYRSRFLSRRLSQQRRRRAAQRGRYREN